MKTIDEAIAEIEKRAANHDRLAQDAANFGDAASTMTNVGAWLALKMIANFVRGRPNDEGLVSSNPSIQIMTFEDIKETLN